MQKLQNTFKTLRGARATGGYRVTCIYTTTQKGYFKGWHNVAYTKKLTWQPLIFEYNCGAGAGQL